MWSWMIGSGIGQERKDPFAFSCELTEIEKRRTTILRYFLRIDNLFLLTWADRRLPSSVSFHRYRFARSITQVSISPAAVPSPTCPIVCASRIYASSWTHEYCSITSSVRGTVPPDQEVHMFIAHHEGNCSKFYQWWHTA